jgi:hypothetical protein
MTKNYCEVCPICFKELKFTTVSICRECSDKGYCIKGCGDMGVSWMRKCIKCEKAHKDGMGKIKQWLKDNNYAHKDCK